MCLKRTSANSKGIVLDTEFTISDPNGVEYAKIFVSDI